MSWGEAEAEREQQLPGGCALGCVMASMLMALAGLATIALFALIVGVGQSVQAMTVPVDSDEPAVADQQD